ncbi:ATPase family protein associated with various cellular activities (AAA) [Motilibacter rhizosphaerae]|uniref:ATPase family protein associated with various cellular activities (AAA) n=1 Tax=Motilibacter rhizosphaerae TaxID=598652 RepID=A0A4Q7NSY3_9ACTN|nr:ATP-binding protein [Motilibacter rhizosphaerae]RZS90094.1 ATPase family protein associated with various cellular activities (AAA) [Motilibacter rhizosphaerae]
MPDEDELRQFARAFRELSEWAHRDAPRGDVEVVRVLRDHLGESGVEPSVVTRTLPPFEHVNLQVALDAWSAADGRRVRVEGVSLPANWGPVDLQQLLHGDGLPPVRLTAPALVDLPSGPGRTRACLRTALLLVEDDALGRVALFLREPTPNRGEPELVVEVAGLPTAQAQELLAELDRLRLQHNVYRGQVIELAQGPYGFTVAFPELPPTERADVVLPEAVLRRVERHALDVARRRDDLRAAGQHLKRGLLLYGPPGTGKTHTTRYLVQHLPGTTALMLSGRSLHLVGAVTALARELQPSAVVLEDVDLVAEDRGFGPGPSPVLFELLDAMDGAASDADLLFLLTTNRADLLEPALAARPGRVDVAVEIGLPDEEARRRLFAVYTRGVPLEAADEDVDDVVARSEGVTASFMKELVRRAVLEALADDPAAPLRVVTGEHLHRALDDLLDTGQEVTRALLGVPADQSAPPGPAAGAARPGRFSGHAVVTRAARYPG